MEYQYSYFPGVDSFTNIGGSAWDHGSGEERNSISQWLTKLRKTIVLAVLLHQCMWFLVTIELEGKNCQLN